MLLIVVNASSVEERTMVRSWMMWLVRLVVIQGLLVMMMQMVGVVGWLVEDVNLLSLAPCARCVVLICCCMRVTPP